MSSVKWSEMVSMNIQESWDLFIKHVIDHVEKYILLKRQNLKKSEIKIVRCFLPKMCKKEIQGLVDIYILETRMTI